MKSGENYFTINGKYWMYNVLAESRNIMEKVIKALLVLSFVFFAAPIWACDLKTGEQNITGAACSIKELNNLEKNKNAQNVVMPERNRDLRPIRLSPDIKNPADDCLFGMCLQKTLLGK